MDVAMEMLCRCARDAYKTEVEVLDVPDEAVLEKQRRETAETIRQLQVQAVQREVSRVCCRFRKSRCSGVWKR